jgi:hypothetical protein
MDIALQNLERTQGYIKKDEELECASLHILQDVEEGSIVETNQLLVDGTTARYSSQFSRRAKINKHKGTLRCHHAEIDTLDGGEVHATYVHINNSLGGTIYAQDVTIDNVHEGLSIFASNSITINLINGSHNTFTIDYTQVPILNSKLELIEHDLSTLTNELQEAKKHNHSIVDKLHEKTIQLEKDKIIIFESYKTAKITLHGAVDENNKIRFTVNGSTLEHTTTKQTYLPFNLSTDDSTITLHPTNQTINL